MATATVTVKPYSCAAAAGPSKSHVVCKYWLAGRCNRHPCRFSHHSPTFNHQQRNTSFRGVPVYARPDVKAPNPTQFNKKSYHLSRIATTAATNLMDTDACDVKKMPLDENHACAEWMSGSCAKAEKCGFPHSWVSSEAKNDIEKIAQIKEHSKSVTGIVLPLGTNILYTGSKDGTLRACDANSGKCIDCINVGAEVGCILCEQSWVFAGLPNAICAWNFVSSQRLLLAGPVGQVNAMVVSEDTLFAACEDGTILAYKHCPENMTFRLVATLKGHKKAVLSLSCSKTQLYSGSEDCTIRCWDTHTFQCTHVLEGHSGEVTCLITWDCALFSGSLDKTIKVWAGTKDGGIEEIHTCYEELGVTAFMGMTDAEAKSVLFASTSDNSVRMYELSTERCLLNRGRLFTQKRVSTISFSGRQVFTGDTCGNVHIWNWLGEPSHPERVYNAVQVHESLQYSTQTIHQFRKSALSPYNRYESDILHKADDSLSALV